MKHKVADRETDRQTDRQTDRRIERQIKRYIAIERDRKIDSTTLIFTSNVH